jgi:WD40 repeat protein
MLWEAIKNANASAMAKISTEFGADILVRGTLTVESHERFAGSWEGVASLSIKVIDTRTAEEIETLGSDPMGSTENPAPMEDSSLAAKQMAIKKTVDDILRKMGISGGGSVLSQLTTIAPVFHAALQGKTGDIRSITFSPDSKYVAVAGESAIVIWDVNDRAEKYRTDDYIGTASCVVFSRDGSLLATGTSRGDILLIEWQAGKSRRIGSAHSKGVGALDFGPESRTLASGGGDGVVRLWDVASGARIGGMGRHNDRIHSLAFEPNGRNVITASDDLTIRVWDANTKKEVRAFAENMDKLITAAFSADRTVVAYSAKTIEIDLTRNRRTDKRFVRMRDLSSGRDLFTFEGHTGDITGVAFLPGRRFILSCSVDKTVKIWDVEKGGEVTSLEQKDKMLSVGASRDGKWMAASGKDRSLMLWKLK